MSMRIFGKKVLAIVMTMAILASCMVFSFSASADATLLWENHFDNGSSTNWASSYKGESDSSPFNTGRVGVSTGNFYNYAVEKTDSNNTFMALGFNGDLAQQRISGFIVLHEGTTNKTAANVGTYGHAGKYRYSSLAQGSFQPDSGKYEVKLDYKVPQIVDGGAIDVYVAFTGALWNDDRTKYYLDNNVQSVYEKMFTVTPDDMDDGWQSFTHEVEVTVPSDQYWYMHIFARTDNSSLSLNGSEVWIDNIQVSALTGLSASSTVSFYHNGSSVGEATGTPGTAFTMPSLSSVSVPVGYRLAYYADEACTQEITVPTVYPDASQTIYVKAVRQAMWENAFENGTSGNWQSKYSTDKTAGTAFNSGNVGAAAENYATLQSDGSNHYMALGFNNTNARRALSGFIMLHKDAVVYNNGDLPGDSGNYNSVSKAQGLFAPKNGQYAISVDYKVSNFVDNDDATIELYAAVGTLYWNGEKLYSSVNTAVNNGTVVLQKLCTVSKADVGADWRNALVYLDVTNSTSSSWISIFAKSDANYYDLTGSEVLIDNVEVYSAGTTGFPTVTFYYEGNEVGKASGMEGAAFTMPTLSLNVPAGSEISYYSNEACTQAVALPTVFPNASQNIYIKVTEPAERPDSLRWENDFDTRTASNWYSKYGDKSGNSSFNTGTVDRDAGGFYNYAVPQTESNGNGYIAFGFENNKGHQRPAGFIVLHQDVTSKNAADAGKYGYAGKYTDGSNLQGAFQPTSGKYAVQLKYKVPDTANLTTDVDLYIVFGTKTWGGTALWGTSNGGITKLENDGQLIKQKIATATQADAGGDWQSAVVYMDVDVPDNQKWWVSVVAMASNIYADPAPTGSEVWVDNVEVYEYNDASDLSDVTIHYDGSVVGKLSGLAGTTFTMPTLSIYTPVGALLGYYADEVCTQPVDLPTVFPAASQDIYIKLTQTNNNTWSFEDEAVDTLLSLSTGAGRTITVDDAKVLTGAHGARVNNNTKLIDYFPQMTLRDGNGQQIRVYKNRSYEISFKVFKPDTEPKYGISYWLTVTDGETPFNRTDYREQTYEVARHLAVSTQVGQWYEMTATVTDCAYTGLLRLGISGDYNAAHSFYIDDITVTEVSPEPESSVDSFERYSDSEQVLSLNTDGASITVSDTDRRSGNNSAKVVTLGNDINAAPQMVVNDFRTDPISVEKGKNYRISFYVLQPLHQPDYDIQYWLAATDSTAAFSGARQNLLVDTQTVTIDEKHVWQRVNINITDCAYSGKLRLGITGSTDAAHVFYIDDVAVSEYVLADTEAMNFEMYDLGTTLDLNQDKNTITVTDEISYTGDKSVHFFSDNNTYDSRPHMFVRDAEGNIVKVKKGEDFFVSFMVYIPTSEPYFNFSYWLAATPEEDGDKPFQYSADRSKYTSRNFLLPGEEFGITPPPAGEWTMIKMAVMDCPYEGNLRIGISHGNSQPFSSNFYIDDIKIYEPEYVLVKFDSNGSEDTYADITMMSDMLIPTTDYTDPYREGYEFVGWYTSPNFEKSTYFDIYTMPIIGKTGDVVTLYACWREWTENVATGGRDETEKYKTEYYTEKVWVGDQNVPEPWDTGEAPSYTEEAPVTVTPEPDTPTDGGIPPWLIVVIIIAAVVVVGGGATVAAILLKKNKNKEA